METQNKRFKELKQELGYNKIKLNKLKTKAAKEKIRQKNDTLISEILDILYNQLAKMQPMQQNGTVISYVSDSEEKFIVRIGQESFWANKCLHVDSKSWYDHTSCVVIEKGDNLECHLVPYVDDNNLFIYWKITEFKGGRIDLKKYEELCKDPNLAFFKYPSGMSGLF